jgi:hypothetical protein
MNFNHVYDICLNSIFGKFTSKQCAVKVKYFLNSNVSD